MSTMKTSVIDLMDNPMPVIFFRNGKLVIYFVGNETLVIY